MNNKRSIPDLRKRLLEIAEEENLPELIDIADETYRRSPNRRAPISSQKLTPALAADIRLYAKSNPDKAMHSIADRFNVNPGRVSEAINREI